MRLRSARGNAISSCGTLRAVRGARASIHTRGKGRGGKGELVRRVRRQRLVAVAGGASASRREPPVRAGVPLASVRQLPAIRARAVRDGPAELVKKCVAGATGL